jgi:HAMP domain-containing protein
MVVGTFQYMAPEQVEGKEADARSDIFALGAVLYEMATGSIPFRGDTSAVIFDAILNRPPVPALRLNPDLPPKLEDIISKCLEKDRNLRYQHASEIRTDLQRLKRDTESGRQGVPHPAGAATAISSASSPSQTSAAAVIAVGKHYKLGIAAGVLIFVMVLGAAALMLAMFGALVIQRSIARPLAAVTKVTEAVAGGDAALPVPFRDRPDEIGALARSIAVFQDAMRRNVELNKTVLTAAEAKVQRQEQIKVQELEILRREKELVATVQKAAEAERGRIEILAEAERQRLLTVVVVGGGSLPGAATREPRRARDPHH